jgi:hypothetical protein
LNVRQKKALQNLQNDPEIILKEADKGGAVICMDKDFYRSLVLQQLTDTAFYVKLPGNPDKNILRSLKQLCHKYTHLLKEKELDYLTNFEMKTSNFYGLPKIHKSNHIKTSIEDQNETYITTSEPLDLKLRPIVAGHACPTHRISNFIDILLKNLCCKVPSYIRDSMDFLNKIPEDVDPDTLLVTFDVTSLYTNIPHEFGVEALTYWIEKYPELIPGNFSLDFIIDSVKFILENNTFHFDGEF